MIGDLLSLSLSLSLLGKTNTMVERQIGSLPMEYALSDRMVQKDMNCLFP